MAYATPSRHPFAIDSGSSIPAPSSNAPTVLEPDTQNAPQNVVKEDAVEEISGWDVSELNTTQLAAHSLCVKYVLPCFVD